MRTYTATRYGHALRGSNQATSSVSGSSAVLTRSSHEMSGVGLRRGDRRRMNGRSPGTDERRFESLSIRSSVLINGDDQPLEFRLELESR